MKRTKKYFLISVRPGKLRHSFGDGWELVEGYERLQNFTFETLRQAQGERGECRVQ